ncbi:hypothetical protein K435DRAFT_969354 [Dendrothele bispora CBS 962.96]|uniref:FAD/NAD(P)-binding domain-containing protein n=1 Tax=Dendrothele bispora (strain CBS 962.96) TaxID=1314807 RepID=A0A4S8LI53_DENBC|nr:hypothetical protein K435DRAFT_969354 [Dendrothele bispora CBS 962.96]
MVLLDMVLSDMVRCPLWSESQWGTMMVTVVGGTVAGCSTVLSHLTKAPFPAFEVANVSLYKVGITLSEEVQEFLSFLTPRHPTERLLQNTFPSSPEINTSHHRYRRPLLTRSSGNTCAWSSASLQENVANPSDGPGIGWRLDRSKFDLVLRDFVQEQRRGSSKFEKKMTLLGRTLLSPGGSNSFPQITQIPDVLGADPDYRSIIKANVFWVSQIALHIARLLTKFQYKLVTDSSGWVESSSSNNSNGLGSKRSPRSSTTTTTTAKENSGPIYQTPVGSTHLTSCCNSQNGSSGDGARWCAVGDSAVAIDPLASQGIVTSMKMGSFVGDVIAKELLIQSEKPLLLELEAEVEAGDEGADVDTDAAEVEKASTKMDAMTADPTDKISVVMAKMRYEREKERLECYRQVGSRFQVEVWGKRR